jgi:8-oxo-dGTP diphosphatase
MELKALAVDRRGNALLEVIKCAETEITSYQPLPLSLVIVQNAGAFMLLKNKYRNEWELPGGMLEPGETPRECAARELREESGYALSQLRFCAVARFRLVADYFGKAERIEYAAVFAGDAPERRKFTENDEMSGLLWYRPGDALADASELDVKLLEYYI